MIHFHDFLARRFYYISITYPSLTEPEVSLVCVCTEFRVAVNPSFPDARGCLCSLEGVKGVIRLAQFVSWICGRAISFIMRYHSCCSVKGLSSLVGYAGTPSLSSLGIIRCSVMSVIRLHGPQFVCGICGHAMSYFMGCHSLQREGHDSVTLFHHVV